MVNIMEIDEKKRTIRDNFIGEIRKALSDAFDDTMQKTEDNIKSLEVAEEHLGLFWEHVGALMLANSVAYSTGSLHKFEKILEEEENYTQEQIARIVITVDYAQRAMQPLEEEIAKLKEKIVIAKKRMEEFKPKEDTLA